MLSAILGNYHCLCSHYILLSTCSGMEEMDATVNSDDETDYSKMDMVCVTSIFRYLMPSCSTGASQRTCQTMGL